MSKKLLLAIIMPIIIITIPLSFQLLVYINFHSTHDFIGNIKIEHLNLNGYKLNRYCNKHVDPCFTVIYAEKLFFIKRLNSLEDLSKIVKKIDSEYKFLEFLYIFNILDDPNFKHRGSVELSEKLYEDISKEKNITLPPFENRTIIKEGNGFVIRRTLGYTSYDNEYGDKIIRAEERVSENAKYSYTEKEVLATGDLFTPRLLK